MWLPMACCCGVGNKAVWGGACGCCGCCDGQGSKVQLDWEAEGGGQISGLTRDRPGDKNNRYDTEEAENNIQLSNASKIQTEV